MEFVWSYRRLQLISTELLIFFITYLSINKLYPGKIFSRGHF